MSYEDARAAIRSGTVDALRALLEADPALATAVDETGRTLLHQATDWPGHWSRVGESIEVLLRAGADPDVGCPHPDNPMVAETPLHWAASSGDVGAATALLEGGAKVDPLGGIFDGCTPLMEATIFEMYDVARILLDHGAANWLPGAAALGLEDEIDSFFAADRTLRTDVGQLPHWTEPPPDQVLLDRAFQFACRAGHRAIAERMLDCGADVDAVSPADTTALDEARTNGHDDIVEWLETVVSPR